MEISELSAANCRCAPRKHSCFTFYRKPFLRTFQIHAASWVGRGIGRKKHPDPPGVWTHQGGCPGVSLEYKQQLMTALIQSSSTQRWATGSSNKYRAPTVDKLIGAEWTTDVKIMTFQNKYVYTWLGISVLLLLLYLFSPWSSFWLRFYSFPFYFAFHLYHALHW